MRNSEEWHHEHHRKDDDTSRERPTSSRPRFKSCSAARSRRGQPDPEGWSRFRQAPTDPASRPARVCRSSSARTRTSSGKPSCRSATRRPALTRERIFLTAARGERLVTHLPRPAHRAGFSGSARRRDPAWKSSTPGTARPGRRPATDGTNVYVFFADFGLLSYDMDGRERWRVPLGPFNNLYGMGASPVLVDDTVVLACDQNTDSFIIAGRRSATDACAGRRRAPRRTAAIRRRSCYKPAGGATRDHRARLVPADGVCRRQRREDSGGSAGCRSS